MAMLTTMGRWSWLVTAALVAGCGAAPVERGIDQMVFVDEEAVEPAVGPAPTRVRLRSRAQGRPPVDDGPAPIAPPRCSNERDGASRSIGRATDGSLESGCELPERGEGYLCRHAARFGADRTVALLQWAAAEVARLHPGGAPVVIGALSRDGGGRLRNHRSHQSGRDADVGYLSSDASLTTFAAMDASNLDVMRSWALLGALLASGEVVYIFMDYDLQALFYRYLEDEGVDEATLVRIFQYPAGRQARRGIIRHASGHRDHFHVRLRCDPRDVEFCSD